MTPTYANYYNALDQTRFTYTSRLSLQLYGKLSSGAFQIRWFLSLIFPRIELRCDELRGWRDVGLRKHLSQRKCVKIPRIESKRLSSLCTFVSVHTIHLTSSVSPVMFPKTVTININIKSSFVSEEHTLFVEDMLLNRYLLDIYIYVNIYTLIYIYIRTGHLSNVEQKEPLETSC